MNCDQMQTWPVFKSHSAVKCFHCGRETNYCTWQLSGYAKGAGEHMQLCDDCNHYTYYDIKPHELRVERDRTPAKAQKTVVYNRTQNRRIERG